MTAILDTNFLLVLTDLSNHHIALIWEKKQFEKKSRKNNQ